MVAFILVGSLLMAAVALTAMLLSRQGQSASQDLQADLVWAETFTLDRYKPLERLLSEDDFLYLRQQFGHESEVSRTLRLRRRPVIRGYLDALEGDFRRLRRVAMARTASSPEQDPQLAFFLWRQTFAFRVALGLLRLKLVFGRIEGASPRSLLDAMQGLLSVAQPGAATA